MSIVKYFYKTQSNGRSRRKLTVDCLCIQPIYRCDEAQDMRCQLKRDIITFCYMNRIKVNFVGVPGDAWCLMKRDLDVIQLVTAFCNDL